MQQDQRRLGNSRVSYGTVRPDLASASGAPTALAAPGGGGSIVGGGSPAAGGAAGSTGGLAAPPLPPGPPPIPYLPPVPAGPPRARGTSFLPGSDPRFATTARGFGATDPLSLRMAQLRYSPGVPSPSAPVGGVQYGPRATASLGAGAALVSGIPTPSPPPPRSFAGTPAAPANLPPGISPGGAAMAQRPGGSIGDQFMAQARRFNLI